MEYTLYNNDCIQQLKEMEDNSIDSIITDPPYEISFMGKGWDGTGIAFNTEVWTECLRVLKPGGHILAFGGTRTYHRMAVAIEDSGFEIRDCIFWCYASGFPKSHNIGKSVDKIGGNSIGWFGEWLKNWRTEKNIPQSKIAKLFPSKTGGLTGCVSNWELGKNMPTLEEYNTIVEHFDLPFKTLEELEREVIGKKESGCFNKDDKERHTIGSSKSVEVDITKGNSPYEGWGTALKPAVEPVVMGRKPFKGSVAQNVLEHGTGGLNIDGCRVETTDKLSRPINKANNNVYGNYASFGNNIEPIEGRFPANLILDEEAGKILDEQSGILKSGYVADHHKTKDSSWFGASGKYSKNSIQRDDLVGGASRFFYCPKVSKKERNEGIETNNHPTIKPVNLLQYLIRLITPKGGVVLDPFMGSGSTGKSCMKEGMDFIGIEKEEEYYKIAEARIEYEQNRNNHHKFMDI